MTQHNGEPPPISGNETRYELAGGGMQITYSRVTLPDHVTTHSMRYQGPNQNQALTFSGNDIRWQTSDLGDQLTVTLQFNKWSGEETLLTILFPHMHQISYPTGIRTIAILAIGFKVFYNPPIPIEMPWQTTYQVFNLEGTVSGPDW